MHARSPRVGPDFAHVVRAAREALPVQSSTLSHMSPFVEAVENDAGEGQAAGQRQPWLSSSEDRDRLGPGY